MTNPSPEFAIRMAQPTFNGAPTEGDFAAVSWVLSPRATLVSGTDSAVLAERKAQLQVLKRDFASADRAVFVRTTGLVIASPTEPIAMEAGPKRVRSP